MSCPLSWETLVAYWAGDLDVADQEAAELHLMGCATCTAQSERVAAVAQGIRASPAPLRVVSGEQRHSVVPKRRWLYSSVGAATLAAAAAVFFLLPRSPGEVSVRLAAPVRDGVTVDVRPPTDAKDVRLEPDGAQANGARLRRIEDGAWLTVRVEVGPPFAVVVSRQTLTPGTYELQLVWAVDGREEARGFYRFHISP